VIRFLWLVTGLNGIVTAAGVIFGHSETTVPHVLYWLTFVILTIELEKTP
jgi:hypothetical protein